MKKNRVRNGLIGIERQIDKQIKLNRMEGERSNCITSTRSQRILFIFSDQNQIELYRMQVINRTVEGSHRKVEMNRIERPH